MAENPTDEILAMAKRHRKKAIEPAPDSKLKADLGMFRPQARKFLAEYRARFSIGPENERDFLLRHFNWSDIDYIKRMFFYYRELRVPEFGIRWDQMKATDFPLSHFIGCAEAGHWSPPPLADRTNPRSRGPWWRIADWLGLIFLVVTTAFVLLMCIGWFGEQLGGFSVVPDLLLVGLLILSYWNFRREARARAG